MTDEVHEITMPKLGETVTEGAISESLKSVGDVVAFDDPLFVIETDKVASEMPSPYDGVLLDLLVEIGETVPVGTVLAHIGPADAQPTDKPAATEEASAETTAAPAATSSAAEQPLARSDAQLLSPVVRRLAAEHNLDLSRIAGSGAGGRIMREDVVAAIEAGGAQVTSAQVQAQTSAATEQSAATQPAAAQAAGTEQVVPLSRIRMVTAERMVESKRIAPHVWTSVEVDLERIAKLRQQHKARFRETTGASLSYLPFIARAVCDALRSFPAVNASIDIENKTMTLHPDVHLGIAVDLEEQGLVAPVVKNADSLNLHGLAKSIKALSTAAKNKTLGSDDLSGSTFTLTNPGPLGSYASAPIINQPNVAIMATDGVARRPTAVGDAIAIHHMSILGFSYDHRAFDGVTAARFLKQVRDALQDRDWEAELG